MDLAWMVIGVAAVIAALGVTDWYLRRFFSSFMRSLEPLSLDSVKSNSRTLFDK